MDERPTEQQIEAARRAVMEAPKTETGILIPPHVAAELAAKDADRDRANAGGPAYNRAQRRAHQKALKRNRRKR